MRMPLGPEIVPHFQASLADAEAGGYREVPLPEGSTTPSIILCSNLGPRCGLIESRIRQGHEVKVDVFRPLLERALGAEINKDAFDKAHAQGGSYLPQAIEVSDEEGHPVRVAIGFISDCMWACAHDGLDRPVFAMGSLIQRGNDVRAVGKVFPWGGAAGTIRKELGLSSASRTRPDWPAKLYL